MFSSLAPERAPAASKNVEDERLRHMHADVAEMLLANTTPRRRRVRKPPPAAPEEERRGRARYGCAFEEEEGSGFAPPRMVWAKVRGYPRWPGQVFDPADALGLALRERRATGAATAPSCGPARRTSPRSATSSRASPASA
ncbi:hypothetical protein ZWY2020_010128 [Hordeum vulgare]|nr:hypothetical protein ZWY2020_010128 [Hordeum vulgare]